jgi:hypothetical protein
MQVVGITPYLLQDASVVRCTVQTAWLSELNDADVHFKTLASCCLL